MTPQLSILLQTDGPTSLIPMLREAFSDPWIGSYQVGFGPPLVGATTALRQAVKSAPDALAKLELYLHHCILNDETRRRLADRHRRLVVRRRGPQEAEALDEAAAEALDLRLRLRLPDQPPAGISAPWYGALPWPADPMETEGRILLRLDDPFGSRWQPEDDGVCVELRVPATAHGVWSAWAEHWSARTGYVTRTQCEPRSRVRRIVDGEYADG